MKRIVVLLSAMLLVVITLCACKGPMIITSNSMLALMADSGAGTEANPYIIKDKVIDLKGTNSNAGIQLQYTTKYVILRNITVLNGSLSKKNINENDRANCLGIFLQFVSNATIENCHLENNNMGMWLEGCQYINVKTNTVIDNVYRGIYLMDSSYCILDGNTVGSDNPEYDDNILLNTNYTKPESKCELNMVSNNDTETIRLQGDKTDYNYIWYNYWQDEDVPSTVTIGSECGTHNDIK